MSLIELFAETCKPYESRRKKMSHCAEINQNVLNNLPK